ncbi:MAG: outer membrane beta-barrel protein [Candidatus Contendobacter sp.]|nr:outer membrane beta-barrel protein [Candidatus Contendobacter sp.]
MSRKIHTAKLAGGFCALLLIGAINAVEAQELFDPDYRPYVSATVGWQTRNRSAESDVIWTDWDNGYNYNLAAGLKLFQHFRIDVEWSWLTNDAKTTSGGPDLDGPATGGTADLTAYTLNVYYDYLIPNTPVELYAGVGYGTYRSKLSGLTNAKISPFGFVFSGTSAYAAVFQARAGLTYHFNDNFQLYAGYRYFNGDKLKFHFNLPNGIEFDAAPKDTTMNSGEIGLRYLF